MKDLVEPIRNVAVRELLADRTVTHAERVRRLTKWRDDARAEQRLASEGGAIDDDGLTANLREIELVLDRLGEAPSLEEAKGPASL